MLDYLLAQETSEESKGLNVLRALFPSELNMNGTDLLCLVKDGDMFREAFPSLFTGMKVKSHFVCLHYSPYIG